MSNWIEIRDKLPPDHLQVLFYIQDECNGYTEDFMAQGCTYSYDDERTWQIHGYQENSNYRITHWQLLPLPPNPWMYK